MQTTACACSHLRVKHGGDKCTFVYIARHMCIYVCLYSWPYRSWQDLDLWMHKSLNDVVEAHATVLN